MGWGGLGCCDLRVVACCGRPLSGEGSLCNYDVLRICIMLRTTENHSLAVGSHWPCPLLFKHGFIEKEHLFKDFKAGQFSCPVRTPPADQAHDVTKTTGS